MPFWIDTHCHLDADEFAASGAQLRMDAFKLDVKACVIPAVGAANFEKVQRLAHELQDFYALGIHPLQMQSALTSDLSVLEAALKRQAGDPRLVAVGEIGLDFFMPEFVSSPMREKQEMFYRAQLLLAKQLDLPVILHVRRSADVLLKHLRAVAQGGYQWRGIAHAFNGSEVQARAFIKLGFKLGFGGAMTFERALHLRHLAKVLPLQSIVLETDAPDMPPTWLYQSASQRAAGVPQGVNSPAELPRIAALLAHLRGISLDALAEATTANAIAALPRLGQVT